MEPITQVALLTEAQKDKLEGQLFAPDSYFYPIQDLEDNWVISTQEQEFCVVTEFLWVKDLPLIPFVPKPYPDLQEPQDPNPLPV